MTIRFDDRVAIVTGAGNGLGRAHALGLASRGAKVVVNDFGGARDGTGGSLTPAETVVEEIRKAGGVAMADGADVSNYEQVKAMVERATREWGSVDLLCANAGILRDKSFAKMEIADFAKVLDVHLTGTFYCCKAVWDGMRERNYGRIVLTTSSSGLFLTPLLMGLNEEARKSLGAQVPHPARLGHASEYGNLAVHIVENPMLNGETIRLDGAIRMAPR